MGTSCIGGCERQALDEAIAIDGHRPWHCTMGNKGAVANLMPVAVPQTRIPPATCDL